MSFNYSFKIAVLILSLGLFGCSNESDSTQPETSTPTLNTPESSKPLTPEVKEIEKKSPTDDLSVREKYKIKLHDNHLKMMKELESTGRVSTEEVAQYSKDTRDYLKTYGDSLAAEFAFNAADLNRGIGNYKQALNMWDIVHKAYGKENHPKVPHSLFQIAFTYDTILDRKDLAKTVYSRFLKSFPKHELANDVQLLLKNLDKSPEDLIKEFQKNKNEN